MKYCKRCFRNITEDVAVCPFCNQSDKLIDYDKEKRGEDFTCSDNSSFSSHIKKDAYDTEDSSADADNAYGNEKRHNIEECENAPEAPAAADPGTPGENFSRCFAYMRTLVPAERQRLIKETVEDIGRRFGPNPDEGSTVSIDGREITVAQFNRLVTFFAKTDIQPAQESMFNKKNLGSYIAVWFVITIIFPPLGIILAVIAISLYTQNKKNKENGQ